MRYINLRFTYLLTHFPFYRRFSVYSQHYDGRSVAAAF